MCKARWAGSVLAAGVLVAAPIAGARPDRLTLDNGVTLIVEPVPGIGWVGVESFYRVGFNHEPEGLTQAAHLLEHLACMGAMGEFAAGEAFKTLNQTGLANAETLAHFTHFDAIVPTDRLPDVFRIEAARLSRLRIDAPIIAQEAPRCYQEAANVESAAQAPMFKFGLMAVNQAWRFAAPTALVKGGLVEAPVERLVAFHNDFYTPGNLTMIVVGDASAADARKLAEESVGRVARRGTAALAPIDCAARPPDFTLRWDSAARAVVIAYPPPDDEVERLALTLRGLLAMQAINTDGDLLRDARFVLGSSHIYPVGDLPFFIYATLKDDADQAAVDRIDARARALLEKEPSAPEMGQMRGLAEQILNPPAPSPASIRQQAKQAAAMMGVDEQRGVGMVVGQAALNLGMAEMLVAGRQEALPRAAAMSAADITALVKRTLAPDKRLVTRLEPINEPMNEPMKRQMNAP